MSNIAFPTFEQFYRAVYGYKPHDWQARLAREVEQKGFLPTNLKAPTGLGKTVLPVIAVYSLAEQVHNNEPRTFAQRIIVAVESQVIVEGISESKEKNKTRHRCLVAGCNPYLENAEKATEHKNKTGHRTAKWPVRSKEGKRLAKERINGNYYKKYRGAKKIGTTWIIP